MNTRYLYLVALSLIIIPSIFFASFVIPILYVRVGYYFIIPWAFLLVSSVNTLLVARSIDPGYLPRVIKKSIDDTTVDMPLDNNNNSNSNSTFLDIETVSSDNINKALDTNPSSSSDSISSFEQQQQQQNPNNIPIKKKKQSKKTININGESITIFYCKSCNIYRPPRCSHCSECNRCVMEFDHHCPWISNCVGKRNYRYFVYFVWSAVGLSIMTMASSIVTIIKLTNEQGSFVSAVAKSPVALLLAGYAFLLFWTLIGLGGYHLHLICKDVTTREDTTDLSKV
ncbi:hypothetical protein PPL_08980 [Heterostelium album PN500]|uniref:Palmitoyltransferase n=1 Tax=Heterostelium pallidum (strain ATCC 26659 / Pp 5 / PN500) TaxID=670386 RepID=D3BK99_HETP5|nr:hypothetical protein PPL_08980 [Heterostelium album PN500]EFA78329.1 hypothetical protein PPL_08980 [Heterostelium album PN500]|eukprot:XP_020430454.1 hypothetical protein PPL_08980 [Heterostelium album PN500]